MRSLGSQAILTHAKRFLRQREQGGRPIGPSSPRISYLTAPKDSYLGILQNLVRDISGGFKVRRDESGGNVAVENRLMTNILLVPLVALLAGCAASPAARIDDIPESLRVPTTEIMTQQARAAGVQIYQCHANKDDAARFDWLFKEPEADLFDKAGKKIGKHYAGPTWEANDGSKVTGELVARANSPDANAIAWLLLSAKSTSGSGAFSGVRYIQRLHTVGGNAPADGCNHASAGSEVRVSYTADYWFSAAKP
jgi:Protein of unknown function (DUF3455)